MTDKERIAELEKNVKELKEIITDGKGHVKTTASVLQEIRRECREKYFGTWQEMRDGEINYGPEGKSSSDYDAIRDILNKTAGLLFKYSHGKTSGQVNIRNLIYGKKDKDKYRAICEKVCVWLKDNIDEYTEESMKEQ